MPSLMAQMPNGGVPGKCAAGYVMSPPRCTRTCCDRRHHNRCGPTMRCHTRDRTEPSSHPSSPCEIDAEPSASRDLRDGIRESKPHRLLGVEPPVLTHPLPLDSGLAHGGLLGEDVEQARLH